MGSPAAGARAGTCTSIGNLGSPALATVDPRGLVTPRPDGWSLDWWIGADDRWHVPAREVVVRQRLLDATPVVETVMRIPGGDAVQRVYAIRSSSPEAAVGADDLVIVEIENRSRLPVAVAFAIRPAGDAPSAGTVALNGTTLTVDGRPAVLLPRRPPDVAGPGPDTGETAHVVFPLPHTATLRVALPLAPPRGHRDVAPAYPTALPAAANVAAGWVAQTGRGLQVDLPDPGWQEAVDSNRRFLLLFAGVDAAGPDVAGALDQYGFHEEAVAVLVSEDHQRALGARLSAVAGPALWALGEHWRLTRDRGLVEAMVELIARAAHALTRTRPGRAGAADVGWAVRGLRAAAELLDAVDEPGAARSALAAADRLGGVEHGDGHDVSNVTQLLAAASPTWTWATDMGGHDPIAAADLLTRVRLLLVRETADGLALCSRLPAGWEGRGFDVRDAPSHAGPISYAVRWHGDRPAILWELQARAVGGGVVLRAPGLDPTWSAATPSGEALLAPFSAPARSFA